MDGLSFLPNHVELGVLLGQRVEDVASVGILTEAGLPGFTLPRNKKGFPSIWLFGLSLYH